MASPLSTSSTGTFGSPLAGATAIIRVLIRTAAITERGLLFLLPVFVKLLTGNAWHGRCTFSGRHSRFTTTPRAGVFAGHEKSLPDNTRRSANVAKHSRLRAAGEDLRARCHVPSTHILHV